MHVGEDGILICPVCKDEGSYLHIELVYVAAREEDQEPQYLSVDAVTGNVTPETAAPMGSNGEGRRHRIALTAYCELCGSESAFVFTQHKGQTFAEAIPINREPHFKARTARLNGGHQ